MPLEQELHTFHEQKEHLLEKYKDRYVLIKGEEVAADFESRGDALREGYKRFGNEAFLVKKVEVAYEPVLWVTFRSPTTARGAAVVGKIDETAHYVTV
jgi:hypothetical protein